MPINESELKKLKALSPYSLPDNTSEAGLTTAQVKEKFYAGLLYLYELFVQVKDDTNTILETYGSQIGGIEEFANRISEFETAFASLEVSVNALNTALTTLQTNLSSANANVETNAINIATLKEYAEENVATLENLINGEILRSTNQDTTLNNSINSYVGELRAEDTAIKNSIDELESAIDTDLTTKVDKQTNSTSSVRLYGVAPNSNIVRTYDHEEISGLAFSDITIGQ